MKFSAITVISLLIFVLPPHVFADQHLEEKEAVSLASDGLRLSLGKSGEVMDIVLNGKSVFSQRFPAVQVRVLTKGFDNFSHARDLLGGAGGFETEGLRGWSDFEWRGTAIPCRAVKSMIMVRQGQFSLSIPPSTLSGCLSIPVSVSPGKKYRIGTWWAAPQGYLNWHFGASPVSQQMVNYRGHNLVNGLFVEWLDSNFHPLDGGNSIRLVVPFSSSNPGWKFQQAEVEAPSSASAMKVLFLAKTTDQDQNLYVDGIKVIESPEKNEPATVKEVAQYEGGRVERVMESENFAVDVDYTARQGFISVNGTVRLLNYDEDAEEALDLTVSFPVDATNGRFFKNLHEAVKIDSKDIYENSVSALSFEWLPVSLYPYIGVETSKGVGVAVALPPIPQLCRLYYDARTKTLNAVFHLGLSGKSKKLGSTGFRLILTGFDPAWGLRGLVKRYVSIFPDFFDSKLDYYSYSFPRVEAHPCSMGDGLVRGVKEIGAANLNGNLASAYVASALGLELFKTDQFHPTSPSYDQIMQKVEELALPAWDEEASLGICRNGYDERPEESDEIARAVIESSAIDAQGRPMLYRVSAPKWWSIGWWEAEWVPNWDPDLYQGYGRWLYWHKIRPLIEATAGAGVRLDAFRWDNFMTSSTIDHRKGALVYADYPLSFDPSYFKAGEPTQFTFYEFFKYIYEHYLNNPDSLELPEIYKKHYVGAGANTWGISCINYIKLDYYGGEGQTNTSGAKMGRGDNWNTEILDYRRSVAYHRPMGFSNFTSSMTAIHARRFLQLALLYGVLAVPNEHVISQWDNEALCLFARSADKISKYRGAGWEPIPFARPDREGFRIERFGHAVSSGLYFAVYNQSEDSANVTIEIDWNSLGISDPDRLFFREVTPRDDLSSSNNFFKDLIDKYCVSDAQDAKRYFRVTGGRVRITDFPPGETRVFEVTR